MQRTLSARSWDKFSPQTPSRSAAAVWGLVIVHDEVNKEFEQEGFSIALVLIGDFHDAEGEFGKASPGVEVLRMRFKTNYAFLVHDVSNAEDSV